MTCQWMHGNTTDKVIRVICIVVGTETEKADPAQELATVVVKGTAQRDDAGNLTVLASGVYVKN